MTRCKEKDLWTCDDNITCIHNDLICDGNVHCADGSDENEEICSVCPKDFGYGVKRATFLCRLVIF